MNVYAYVHALTASPRGEASGMNWIGGWVSSLAALNVVEKRITPLLQEIEPRPSTCSHSLYLLSYHGNPEL
jgi:hypothetical protein